MKASLESTSSGYMTMIDRGAKDLIRLMPLDCIGTMEVLCRQGIVSFHQMQVLEFAEGGHLSVLITHPHQVTPALGLSWQKGRPLQE
jgi:hypothetical protein